MYGQQDIEIIDIYFWYSTNGVPFEFTINHCIRNGISLSFIHELSRALWRGCTVSMFMELLKEAILFTPLPISVIERMNLFVSQMQEPTTFNYKILTETEI